MSCQGPTEVSQWLNTIASCFAQVSQRSSALHWLHVEHECCTISLLRNTLQDWSCVYSASRKMHILSHFQLCKSLANQKCSQISTHSAQQVAGRLAL